MLFQNYLTYFLEYMKFMMQGIALLLVDPVSLALKSFTLKYAVKFPQYTSGSVESMGPEGPGGPLDTRLLLCVCLVGGTVLTALQASLRSNSSRSPQYQNERGDSSINQQSFILCSTFIRLLPVHQQKHTAVSMCFKNTFCITT